MNEEIKKETIANRVKQIRKTLNIKGKELARRIKISGASLSEIENGKYYPNFEFIYHLVNEFNVNLYYLFFGEGNMFIGPGKRSDMSILEELVANIGEIRRFIYYFERSEIIRYFVLSQFKSRLMADKELVEKELEEFSKGTSGKEKY